MTLNYNVENPVYKKPSKWEALIEEFEASGKEFAEIKFGAGDHKNPKYAASHASTVLRKIGKNGVIRARYINGRAYLVRK